MKPITSWMRNARAPSLTPRLLLAPVLARASLRSSLVAVFGRSCQVEKGLETDCEACVFADRADGQQHARHERRAVQAVVPDCQRFPLGAEKHFLVSDQPGEPH